MKKILVISPSVISSDQRVIKQIKTLLNNNYYVISAGFGNLAPLNQNHRHIQVINKHNFKLLFISLNRAYNFLEENILPMLNLSFLSEKINPFILDFKNKLKDIDFDFIISNEILTLPVSIYLANKNNLPLNRIILDLHEYYPKEFEDNLIWKLTKGKFYNYLLNKYKKYLNRINITTVSNKIAELYKNNYDIKNIYIMRNIPYYQDIKPVFREENEFIRLVHIGGAIKSRKLEISIQALKYTQKKFILDFYLIANSEDKIKYLNYLKKLANEINQKTHNKVNFYQPLSHNKLIKSISTYDLGIFTLYPSNINYNYALPNKIFEYIQSRLGIVITPNPEMASLVKEYNVGLVSEDFSPISFAKTLDKLNTELINKFKINSDTAAKILNYNNEEKILLSIIQNNI
jgi:hypothetical protein